MAVGITVRRTSKGVTTYRAEVAKGPGGSKTFPTMAAAKSWRAAKITAIRNGEQYIAPTTLAAAAESWLVKAVAGTITNREGQRYKPSVLRGYEQSLRLHALPVLGHYKLTDIRLALVQDLVDTLSAAGLAPQSVKNHIIPLRVIFNDALRRELARVNPCVGLALPSGETARDRIATPSEAVALLGALDRDRALWATAFYTGLRRGELAALDWSSVDLVARTVRVERGYDHGCGEFVAAKSKAGVRTVPFPDLLLPFFTSEDRTTGLVFGSDGVVPFGPSGVRKRALVAWESAQLRPVTLHECRHTYASLMLAAGVDMTKVSKWMGHSSITITVDRYGHLVPGDEREDMARFQAFLTR